MDNQVCGFFTDALRNLKANGNWQKADMIRAMLARGLATLPSDDADLSTYELTEAGRAALFSG